MGEKYNFEGKHYQLTDSPALPKPVQQPHPPIVVGGAGKKRTPALAARYAAEFNAGFRSVEETETLFQRVRAACESAGRDAKTLNLSTAHTVVVGKDDAQVKQRAEAIGRDVDDLKANSIAGTPAEVVDRLGQYAAIGSQREYVQIMDLHDLAHLDLIAAEVLPQVS